MSQQMLIRTYTSAASREATAMRSKRSRSGSTLSMSYPPHLVVHEDEHLGIHGDEIDAVRAMLFMCNKGCAVVAQ